MAISVHSKIKNFWADEKLKGKFLGRIYDVDIEELLNPELKPAVFGRGYVVRHGKKRLPYPLIRIPDRLYYVQKYIEHHALHVREKSLNPVAAYYYLKIFQQKYAAKKSIRKKKQISTREQNKRKIYLHIGRIIQMLDVPLQIKRIKGNEKLINAVLQELQNLSSRYVNLEDENKALSIEADISKRARTQRNKEQERQDKLESSNAQLKSELDRQTRRANQLESDFRKMADKIIGEQVPDERSLLNELSLLRHEYNLISQKYDTLVSKNIDLSNRLDSTGPSMALEDILNSVRDRVNRILRSAASSSDEVLLSGLRNEIEQLQRARIYLGRALYDIGLLYLRSGNKEDAIRELRAARELGVDNYETNTILGKR